MIEQGIAKLLLANAGVSTLISARLYPVLLPDPATYPAATLQTISSVPYYTNDGPVGMAKYRVQIDTWADDYATAKAIANAIRLTLDGYRGTVPTGEQILSIWRDSAQDLYEPETRKYRVTTDYRLLATE